MMKLVWHAENLSESDWIRAVLGPIVDSEETDVGLSCFDDHTIHVISGNGARLSAYDAYFQACRARCQRLVLFHLSDEWFSGGYRLYRHFDLVIRNYHTYLAAGEGILTVPLGYPKGTEPGKSVGSADTRKYVWSFLGEIKASRATMRRALDGLHPQCVPGANQPRVGKAEFDEVLRNSVFSPCPMGNVVVESWRLYESLEVGCIPLVESRWAIDYFRHLLGPNPLPAFANWREARRYVEILFADKPRLVRTQGEIERWWAEQKAAIFQQVREALEGPSHAPALQRFADRLWNRRPIIHEVLRLVELLRHQNAASLSLRFTRPFGPLKRIIAGIITPAGSR